MSSREPRPLRRRFETRRRLLASAADLLDTWGTIDQTVEAICTKAGYSRGAFYSNFDSVEHLYFTLQQQQAHAVRSRLVLTLGSQISRPTNAESLDDAVAMVIESVPPARD